MDSSECQTFAVSPAEPGDFSLFVNHKDWVSKEWKTLRRIKLEELIDSIYEIFSWHNKKVNNIISNNLIDESQILIPIYKIRAIVLLYFPELLPEFHILEKHIYEFNIWSKKTIVNFPEYQDRIQHVNENIYKNFADIISDIDLIEEKSRKIMQNIICNETDQIQS